MLLSVIHGFSAVNRMFASEDFSFLMPAPNLWLVLLKDFENIESAKNTVIAEFYQKF